MTVDDVPWYRAFFDEHYLRLYGPRLSAERTDREVDGIVERLGLPPESAILDLCCGQGRHAIALALRRHRLTGQDLSSVLLDRARADAEAHGVEVRWVHGDMREIPFDGEFDAVINVFTAFGYLESEEEDRRVLDQVRKALKVGGRFLLETIHRESLVRRYQQHEITHHDDGLLVLEEHRFDLLSGRNEVRVTLIERDGRRAESGHSVRIYTLTELARMLGAAGLPIKAYYGGLDGSPLSLDSQRLVVVGRKAG